MKHGRAIAVVLAVAGCTRTTNRYASSRISLDPAFVAAAPGEKISFHVSGGDGRAHFSFDKGAAASGPDASIDDMGHYQAGSLGTVDDVIVVSDDSLDTSSAKVSLGPAL